jgi:hypothetical protein
LFCRGKKFRAQVQIGGTQHYLGTYPTEEEAARVYDLELTRRRGVTARTNFEYPQEDLEAVYAQARAEGADYGCSDGKRGLLEFPDVSSSVNPSYDFSH